MKFCINCGKEIKDKVKFCPFCGAEQKEIKTVIEPVEQKEVSEEIIITPEEMTEVIEPVAENTEEMIVEESVEQPQPEPVQPIEPTQQTTQEQQANYYQQPNNHYQGNSNQQQNNHYQGNPNQQQQGSFINQEKMNQLTDNSKNYFSYLNKNMAKPNIGGRNTNNYFGVVSYVLIALFSSLAISHSIGKAVSFGTRGLADSSFPMFLQLFLLLLVTQLISVTTVFVLSGKIFHEETSFLDSFDRVYAPISLAVYTSLLAFVLSFISAIGFSFLFVIALLLTYFLTSISFVANLWVSVNHTQKNKFYWTIGVIIVSFIVQVIVGFMLGDIIGTSIMDIFSNITGNITDSLTPRMFY